MDFSEQVLQTRCKLNISQKTLAGELGVTNVTISRWENGKSYPTKRQQASFVLYCKKKKISFSGGAYDD